MISTYEITHNGKTLTEILRLHKCWLSSDGGERADLRSADLSSADLSSADLSSADLSSADLSSANLRSADLSSADLSFANLSSADLSFADLSFANLRSADLSSADLSSADLSFEVYQLSRIGTSNRLITWDATNDIIWCGCFKGTIERFSEDVEETHKKNPKYLAQYRSAISYLKSLKQINEECK